MILLRGLVCGELRGSSAGIIGRTTQSSCSFVVGPRRNSTTTLTAAARTRTASTHPRHRRQFVLPQQPKRFTSSSAGMIMTGNVCGGRGPFLWRQMKPLLRDGKTATTMTSPTLVDAVGRQRSLLQQQRPLHHQRRLMLRQPLLRQSPLSSSSPRRSLSFSYAGPRSLHEILKVELLADKSASEISDIWLHHHEQKEHVVGICLKGHEGTKVLERASKCRFYVQPIFRDDGFFMLLSQFQDPNHFLLAYLEDYKMDPSSATPLVTFALFTDLVDTKDLALVRADVLSAGITDAEAYKVVRSVVTNYLADDEYGSVQVFNQKSSEFDIDDYISRMNDRWNQS